MTLGNKTKGHMDGPESFIYAGLAQLVVQLTCNQQVGGSIPLPSSIWFVSSDG